MAEQIFPTKGNLIACKKNLLQAKLGFDLLDRKRNVLMREMMKLIDEAGQLQKDIGDTFTVAYSALQAANVTLGIGKTLGGVVQEETQFYMSSRSIMGVDLPTTELRVKPVMPYYGFNGSNAQLDYAYLCFNKVKALTARLAGVENSVYRLAVAIKKTQRRANMLENVNIPRFESNIKFISGVLEEREREEFSRLKVIKRSKEKQRAFEKAKEEQLDA
ncbi:MAG: V-type ATP synthase subunit D [Oscillospiraceae bacterium]|nr:V-type ATP synthase subunit D [Oscillospiraceae bacterium]